MQILVHAADELPIYRQIMRQITDAIAGGRLKPGDRLSSHRELGEQLVIAPLTVKKAYDELEALGYIETHRGRDTFVCQKLPKRSRAAHYEQLQDSVRKLLSQIYLSGLTYQDALQMMERADYQLSHGTEKESA